MRSIETDEIQYALDLCEGAVNNFATWDKTVYMFSLHTLSPNDIGFAQIPLNIPSKGIGHYLYQMAETFRTNEHPSAAHIQKHLLDRNVFGFAIFMEVMTNFEAPIAEQVQGKSLWDIPGSIETRLGICFDLLGRQYQTLRRRNEPALMPGQINQLVHTGSVPKGIHRLCLAIASNMPDGLDYVEALAKITFPTKEEVRDAAINSESKVGTFRTHFFTGN